MKKLIIILITSTVLIACQTSGSEQNNLTEKTKEEVVLKDYGKEPLVINIEDYTLENETFRTAIWTGDYFQLTVMSIPIGGEVGLEVHHDIEQFLRIEAGDAQVLMGDSKNNLSFTKKAGDDDVVFVPAGKWHNVVNVGTTPLKLYSIYAKPEHSYGTVHKDKAESDADHHDHDH